MKSSRRHRNASDSPIRVHFYAVWGAEDHALMMEKRKVTNPMHVVRCDLGKFPVPRKGEGVGIFDYRAFGKEQHRWLEGLRKVVKDKGAFVVPIDRETGAEGEAIREVSGAEVFFKTLDERRRKFEARAMASRRHADKVAARLPVDQAHDKWFDWDLKTVKAALAQMPGWTRPTAYNNFGRRKGTKEAAAFAEIVAGEKKLALAERRKSKLKSKR